MEVSHNLGFHGEELGRKAQEKDVSFHPYKEEGGVRFFLSAFASVSLVSVLLKA